MNQNTRNVATLVIELGLEELPPKAMRTLALAFAEGVQTALQQARLTPTTVMPLAAPRRLAVMVTGLARSQSDDTQVLRGPPLKVAFDEAGEPTRAAIAFADKNGVSVDALEREITDKGEWLQVTRHIQGRSAEQIIAELLGAVAESLPIPKRMRWGDSTASFVRPLHWLMVMLDDAVVDCELFGVKSGNKSRGHRFHANEWFELDAAVHYVQALENRQVIVEMDKRTAVVRDQVTTLAKSLDGAVEPDEALVEEITALCDWPVAIAGQFDARFLQLPSEVLSATLKVHQRYFPVVDQEGQQTRHFITVANIDSVNPQAVQQGNERVIAPRLADAAFFWDNDCKQPLSARVDRLLNIVYQRELGSIADKSARTIAIATQLAEQLHIDVEPIQRAALLARCDLVTDMVGEFPELQGVMGAYYAARDGEPESVVAAIRDQYKPAFAGDAIPS
ncbi:MAG: glycine--tRNA ligase subunit beta, partial [Pseudomonadota bacterium]